MIKEDILILVSEILNVPLEELNEDSCIGEFSTWDSLGHLTILQSIQKNYDIELTPREKLMIESIGDIISTVKNKLS